MNYYAKFSEQGFIQFCHAYPDGVTPEDNSFIKIPHNDLELNKVWRLVNGNPIIVDIEELTDTFLGITEVDEDKDKLNQWISPVLSSTDWILQRHSEQVIRQIDQTSITDQKYQEILLYRENLRSLTPQIIIEPNFLLMNHPLNEYDLYHRNLISYINEKRANAGENLI